MPILEVPQITQWGTGANRYVNDCGPACVAMLLKFYGKLGALTVDNLADETGLRGSDDGLLPAQLVTLALRHGLTTVARAGITLADLRTEIDAGRPVIALVAYGYILGRLDQNFRGGHYFVVVGYDDEHLVVSDPDYWIPYVEQGHDILVPIAQIEQALAAYSGQCVVVEESLSLADEITALAVQIQEKAKQIPVGEPDPDKPTKYVVTTAKLNVRPTPDTTQAPVAVLPANTQVKVYDEPGDWLQLAALYPGKWINAAYTRPT